MGEPHEGAAKLEQAFAIVSTYIKLVANGVSEEEVVALRLIQTENVLNHRKLKAQQIFK